MYSLPLFLVLGENFELLFGIMLNDDYIGKGRFKIYNTHRKTMAESA